jgi:thymidylate synthase ThyX
MAYEARLILDSVGPNEARLTTFELTYPRFVHAELMTHRVFSRNAASSRAIPTAKLIARVVDDPAMPVYWGSNQAGMAAGDELTDGALGSVKKLWLDAKDAMVKTAELLNLSGLHKQIANRVIEPWMFITVLVTATEWDNFFALRVHKAAQPEIREVAAKALELYRGTSPRILKAGQWHLPLVTGRDEEQLKSEGYNVDSLCRISVARCARVTHLTHEGIRDPEADLEMADSKLATNGHMSPFEHPAMAMTEEEWLYWAAQQFVGWQKYRVPMGNFWGFKQYRKTMRAEHNFGLIGQ